MDFDTSCVFDVSLTAYPRYRQSELELGINRDL